MGGRGGEWRASGADGPICPLRTRQLGQMQTRVARVQVRTPHLAVRGAAEGPDRENPDESGPSRSPVTSNGANAEIDGVAPAPSSWTRATGICICPGWGECHGAEKPARSGPWRFLRSRRTRLRANPGGCGARAGWRSSEADRPFVGGRSPARHGPCASARLSPQPCLRGGQGRGHSPRSRATDHVAAGHRALQPGRGA